MAKFEIQTVDSVRRRIEVEIPAADVAAEIERSYDELRRGANVRGFRRGRVPRAVLERLFGNQVRAEAQARLVERSLTDAVREAGVEPLGRPDIVTESADPGQALRFAATVEVKPDVTAREYLGLEVEQPLRAIGEEDVDRYLEALRGSYARVEPVHDRKRVEAGDVATVDYEARAGDRVVGRGRDRLVEAGGEDPDALGARLVGLPVGQESTFEVDYPADYREPEIAGRRVSFRVQVRSIGVKQIPPLDDAFARERVGSDTVGELRARAKAQLEVAAAREADGAMRAALVDRLVGGHDFEVPRSLVVERGEALVEEVLESLGARRPPASREGELRARLRAELEGRARDLVKAALLLEAIAAQERLEVGAEDLQAYVERIASQAGGGRDRVRAFYEDAAHRESLRKRLLRDRALDLVVQRARVRTVATTSGVAGEGGNG